METAKSEYARYYYVFNKLGYDTRLKGTNYFFCLLQDVRNDLKENVPDEELLKDRITDSMRYDAKILFAVSFDEYKNKIKEFLTSERGKPDNSLLQEIEDIDKVITIELAALVFAKYFNSKIKKQNNTPEKGPKK